MLYKIDKKTSDRMNILKGMLMVLVVFIHAYRERVTFVEGNVVLLAPQWLETVKTVISQIVARSAVPTYFLLSAVLLYRKEFMWKQNMFKKLNTIFVPYIFLNSFWILFFYFAQQTDFGASCFVAPPSQVENWGITGWLEAYLGYFDDPYPILYPTWFLRDLFVLNALAVVIKKCVDACPKLVLGVVLCLWLVPLPVPFIGGGEVSGQSFTFFILGYYVVKYNIRMEALEKCSGWLMSGIYGVLVLLSLFIGNTGVSVFLRHLTIMAGMLWLVKMCQLVEGSSLRVWFLRFSKHSFFIYLFHEMWLTIAMKLVARWVAQSWKVQVLEYFGLPVLVIVLCVLASIALQKALPGFYGMITGYRGENFQS